jgi:hypothetical protein
MPIALDETIVATATSRRLLAVRNASRVSLQFASA